MVLGLQKHTRPLFMAAGLAIAGVAFGGLGGCSKTTAPDAKAAANSASHAVMVSYTTVAQATTPVQIMGTGTISAWQEVTVGAETGGLTAVALLVDEGQTVKQGQPLLKMDDVLLQAQLKQAQANFDQANKAFQRAQTLFTQGYLSAAGLDNAQASKLTTEAALQTAQTQLSLATVRAPVSGIVTSRKAVLGQIVSSGAELFRIVRDGRIELNMQVVDSDLHTLQPGMAATVSSTSTGVVAGTVRVITPQVDPSTRLGIARVSVPWTSGLRPGMFASGSIDAGMQTVALIPQNAVVYQENVPAVYLVGADNKAHLRKITLGATAANKSIVVRDGLQVGDKIVTTGAGFLNDGDSVKASAMPQAGGEK